MTFGDIRHFIFLGGGQLLVDLLPQLRERQYKVTFVTSPRHARGTVTHQGKALALEDLLQQQGVEYFVSQDVNQDQQVLALVTNQTLGLSQGAAWILKKSFIDRFQGRLINWHGTCLPQDRGGGGFSWRIMRGERRGCHLFHRIDTGIDTGHIIFQQEFNYPDTCLIPQDYEDFYATKAVGFTGAFLDHLAAGHHFEERTQDETKSIYFPRLATSENGWIDWRWSAQDINNFINAFGRPYAGAATYWRGEKILVHGCRVSQETFQMHPFMSGLVLRNRQDICVAAPEGALLLKEILDAGGKNITADVRPGERLITPSEKLDEALAFRAVYDPGGLKKKDA